MQQIETEKWKKYLTYKILKFVKFCISKRRHIIGFLFGRNANITKSAKYADLHGDANYWFFVSLIDNRHFAHWSWTELIKIIWIISKLFVQIT